MMCNLRRLGIQSAMSIFLCAFLGHSQTITGSISGRVLDPQMAAIGGATVTITEPSRNFSAITRTVEDGNFLSAGLLPGNYTVAVEMPGFKKLTRIEIPLNANDKLNIGNLQLEVGTVTESIEVSAQAELLQTESVERSAIITGHQIQNIEVNGRNPLDLAKLAPGVLSTANFSLGGINGLNNINVNGNRGSQNQVTINGIGAVDSGNNGQQSVVLSIDAISEFKILTGIYQAEYGRSMGGQISMVTKSGGEQFHGSGFWYHRHDSLNANTFLNNVRGLPKPLFRYNDPGYSIGGPIFIPKVFESARHKAFFFWSQEFQRQLSPQNPRNQLVPTALERQGDFSQSLDNNGQPFCPTRNSAGLYDCSLGTRVAIRDPVNGQPFQGNVIPKERIYAPGQALLNFYPLPNVTQVTNFNYTSQLPGKAPRREDLLRLDYNVTDRLHLFGHWIEDKQPNVSPYGSFVLGIAIPVATIANPTPGRGVGGGATMILSPTLTNEVNIGFGHNALDIFESSNVLRRSTSGINLPVLYPNAAQDDYIPNIVWTGTRITATASPNLGTSNAPFHAYNTTIDISDNLTKVWRTHTLKTGMYLQRSTKDQSSFSGANGTYNFGDNPSNPYDTGFGYSNALLGVYNTFSQTSAFVVGLYRYWNVEGFIQDTWKVRRNVTLDYGMRLAWYQPQYDTRLQASTFVPQLYDPAKAPRLYQPAIDPSNNQRAAYDAVTNTYLPSFNIGLEVPGSGDPFNGICRAGTALTSICSGACIRNGGRDLGLPGTSPARESWWSVPVAAFTTIASRATGFSIRLGILP